MADGDVEMVANGVGGGKYALAMLPIRVVYAYAIRVEYDTISSYSRWANCSTISVDALRLTVREKVVFFLFSVYVMDAAPVVCTSNILVDICESRLTAAPYRK